ALHTPKYPLPIKAGHTLLETTQAAAKKLKPVSLAYSKNRRIPVKSLVSSVGTQVPEMNSGFLRWGKILSSKPENWEKPAPMAFLFVETSKRFSVSNSFYWTYN